MGKRRKKRTPEERAAELAHSKDLDRRLREMIERYRVLNARRRSERTMEKRRKLTSEERRARRLRHEDLTRRLEQMIERYRRLNAERRAAQGP
jgi:hypothetical protein